MNETPFIRCENVGRIFEKNLDFAAKIARMLGAGVSEERVRAVDNVNLYVNPGEVVGLVGESGCGKSTLGRMICGILPLTSGKVFYKGRDVAGMTEKEQLDYAVNVQMIFQDPFASLNPRKRVKQIIGEAPLYHGLTTAKELDTYLDGVMEQ
ncbi:MAG: ATP-binding cassette domain-containing protein, partial [Desulfobacterales bacterium]|nr:ATP-binding cassette domain-containing protein [Desulfobacterales bacterium]